MLGLKGKKFVRPGDAVACYMCDRTDIGVRELGSMCSEEVRELGKWSVVERLPHLKKNLHCPRRFQ